MVLTKIVAVNYICKRAPSEIIDGVLSTSLELHEKYKEK